MGTTYKLLVEVLAVAPDADEDTPENGAAEMGEAVAAIEAAIADLGMVDVEAEAHPDGVEVWSVDGATVTSVNGMDYRTWDQLRLPAE